MKKKTLMFMVVTVMLASGSFVSAFEAAITNPTQHLVFVDGYGVAPGSTASELAMTIGVHSNETLNLDMLHYVPSGLTGKIRVDGQWLKLRPVTIAGGDVAGVSDFKPLPGDSRWKICWKAGVVVLPLKDNQYGFCKQ
ncbi:MAG: hypothetical protein PHC52_05405 [Syntrophales bacterium]|nr:hypothetical protein [Syntrophales bacterium]